MDPRRLLPALAAVACACLVATLVVTLVPQRTAAPPRAARPAAASSDTPPPGPAVVLADWDERRATAWAQGDPEALADLYVAGSRTGAADVRLLQHYGARVSGVLMSPIRSAPSCFHLLEGAEAFPLERCAQR